MAVTAPQAPAVIDFDYRPPGRTLARFIDSDAFARCVVGPMYGGRRTACIYDIVLRAACHERQGHWRWAAIRATLDELETHTIPAWQKIAQPAKTAWDTGTPGTAARHVINFAFKDREVGRLEVLFLAMDQASHRRKLATLELTAAWLDAARDLPQAVFDELVGAVGQYPSQLEGGCLWSGVILSTRPPPADHWIPALFDPASGAAPHTGYQIFRQPSGRGREAENLAHLPKGFYQRAAQGKPADWVRVNLDGEYASIPFPPEEIAFAREMLDREIEKLAEAAARLQAEQAAASGGDAA